MTKKIAIIACAMALPGEKGYSRFDYLAKMLCEKGYKVDLYTSTFNHWEKAQRDKKSVEDIQKKVLYRIILAKEPGYKKNVDIRRVISHLMLSNSTVKYLEQMCKKEKYDLVYCVIPDNALAAKVSRFGRKNHIPVIIDIEYLWPEGLEMIFHIPLLSKIIFWPFRKYAKQAYDNASAYVGTSDEFRDVPLKYKADRSKPRITVYVGCDIKVFDEGCRKYRNEISKNSNEFWVIYTGTLGSSYDIATLIKSAQEIKKQGYENIKFKILGNGPMKEKFLEIASEEECNIDFLGYIPYEKMAAYLVKSDVTVNSFVKKAPQSIVNKVGDYLAAGKPMINTLSSPEFREKVRKDGFGINVEAENVTDLTKAILKIYREPILAEKYGKNARIIADSQFDRKNAYLKILDLISEMTG